MTGFLKYKIQQQMIKLYRRHFGKGFNPVYLIKLIFEIALTLVILALVFYFLLPE